MVTDKIKKRIVSGTIWSFLGKVVTGIAGVVIYFFLARLLDPEAMGAYFLSLSLATVGAMVAELGLNRSVVRLVAGTIAREQYGRTRSLVSRTLVIGTLSATAFGLLIWSGLGGWVASSVFKSAAVGNVAALVALWTAALSLQNLTAESLRGFHDIPSATVHGGLLTHMLTVIMLSCLWLFSSEISLPGAVLVTIVAVAANVIMALFSLRRAMGRLPIAEGVFQVRELMGVSWPLWITNLLLFMLLQANLWILGYFRPDEEVALYGASARLVALVQMPLMVINAVMPSTIAEMYARKETAPLENLLRKVATLAGWPALLVVLTFIIFGEPILALVYGSFYAPAHRILLFLSLGQLVNVWVGAAIVTLMMTGRQVVIMSLSIFTGGFNILLSILAASRYGANGVAVVYCVTITLHAVLAFLLVRWKLGIWTHMSFSLASVWQGLAYVRRRHRGIGRKAGSDGVAMRPELIAGRPKFEGGSDS